MQTKIIIIILILLAIGTYSLIYLYDNEQQVWVNVQTQDVVEAVYGLGTVASDNRLDLQAAVKASVKKIHIKEGDSVKEGELLVELTNLPDLKAPFFGTVTYLPISEDEILNINSDILTLVDLDNLYILVSLEQKSAIKIKQNQKVLINFEAMRDKRFTGKVSKVYPRQGEFLVKIIPTQKLSKEILVGMSADVAIEISLKKNAFVVPIKAVINGEVTIKSGNKINTIKVETILINEQYAEVISTQIKAGDSVLIKGP